MEKFEFTALLASLANLDCNRDRMLYFAKNLYHLEDFQMIYVDEEKGLDKTLHIKEFASLDFEKNSLYYSNRLVCVNSNVIINAIDSKDTVLGNQILLTLDSQIASEFNPSQSLHRDSDFTKTMEKMLKSGICNFDIGPYIIESILREDENAPSKQMVLETIKNFELAFPDRIGAITIDQRMHEVKTYYYGGGFKGIRKRMWLDYQECYLYLLTMVYINQRYRGKSASAKLENFLDYCAEKIGKLDTYSNNLAKLYFENQNLLFFRKVNGTNKEIFKNLKNMAWDVYHLKSLVKMAVHSLLPDDVIFIPILLSKDKGLNEIRQAFQIKCLIYNMHTRRNVYQGLKMSVVKYGDKLWQKFYRPELVELRLKRHFNVKKCVDGIENLIITELGGGFSLCR